VNERPHPEGRLDRRGLLLRAAAGAIGVSSLSLAEGALPALASSDALSGTIQFSNYPGWIGKRTIPDFQKANPGVKVKQSADQGSFVSLLPKIKAQPGLYDMALAGIDEVQRGLAAGVVERLDFKNIPNSKLIDPKFLGTAVNKSGDYFIPTDFGKTGIAIRTDLVHDPITSWADLWKVAPKYSGKIYVYDFAKDLISTALMKLGYSGIDSNKAHIAAAGKELEKLKPHIGNLGTNGIAAALVNGSAAISITYDYDAYQAALKNKHIRWINPKEGMAAYLEGWVALKGHDVQPEIEAFIDFALQPKYYADFVRDNSTAWTIPSARRYLPPALAKSPILFPSQKVLRTVVFEAFLGEAEQYYDRAYTEFKAS
jgi:spermidine/putrescine transport system substrate-binding protein